MKQSALRLPSLTEVPKPFRTAFKRLESAARCAGWAVCRGEKTDSSSVWSLRISDCSWSEDSGENDRQKVPPGWFKIERTADRELTIRHRHGLGPALEELRRQFLAFGVSETWKGFMEIEMVPRVELRGIRLRSEDWLHPSVFYGMERYAALGFNAVLLDVVPIPNVNPLLPDENRPAEWEQTLDRVLKKLGRLKWWRMMILPVELDLGSGRYEKGGLVEKPLCRQHPTSRRKLLHRFESLVRHLPSVESFGFTATDWGRCRCPLCSEVTYEEEVAYYMRAYSAVLKRYAPDTELWILPDPGCWRRLQEIRSQIPSSARFLVDPSDLRPAGEEDPFSRDWIAEGTAEWNGEFHRFVPFHPGGWLDFQGTSRQQLQWEQSDRPRLVATNISEVSNLDVINMVYLVWGRDGEKSISEEWIYRLVLPPERWSEWKDWKERNELIRRLFTNGPEKEPDRTKVRRRQPDRPALSPAVVSAVRELARWNGSPSRHETSDGFDLISSLVFSARRWLGETRLLSLFKKLDRIPEDRVLSLEDEAALFSVLDELDSFLISEESMCFCPEERHCLENLKDFLSLFLLEWRTKRPWRRDNLPDLWIRECLIVPTR